MKRNFFETTINYDPVQLGLYGWDILESRARIRETPPSEYDHDPKYSYELSIQGTATYIDELAGEAMHCDEERTPELYLAISVTEIGPHPALVDLYAPEKSRLKNGHFAFRKTSIWITSETRLTPADFDIQIRACDALDIEDYTETIGTQDQILPIRTRGNLSKDPFFIKANKAVAFTWPDGEHLEIYAEGVVRIGERSSLQRVWMEEFEYDEEDLEYIDSSEFVALCPGLRFSVIDETGFILATHESLSLASIRVAGASYRASRESNWVIKIVFDGEDLMGSPDHILVELEDVE